MSGSGAREAVLSSIRHALGRGSLEGEARTEAERRLAAPAPNLIPARAALPRAERVALFIRMAEGAMASVAQVADASEVPGAVSDYLARHNLPSALAMAPDPALDACPWDERPMLAIRRGRAEAADAVAVTGAVMGFAETGTLMTASGPEHPSTLNFLPETHIVILPAERIAGSYEEGWTALRAKGGALPSTVNLITGPSRTGDIEQTIQLGAHGPRRLHIVVVGGGE